MYRRSFWLVQRLIKSPEAAWKASFPDAKVRSNPFGYGRLGDYELDYMGAAEFEWGAIPKANNRLAEGTPILGVIEDLTFKHGRKKTTLPPLDVLWLEEDGAPDEEMQKWLDEGARTKESMHSFDYIIRGEEPPEFSRDAKVWWALEANVQWGLHDDTNGHLLKMLDSMKHVEAEFLR